MTRKSRFHRTQSDTPAQPTPPSKAEAALLAMPDLTRSIFIARRFHDLPIVEICRQTGLSRKQVIRHLTRAVEILHKVLHEP